MNNKVQLPSPLPEPKEPEKHQVDARKDYENELKELQKDVEELKLASEA